MHKLFKNKTLSESEWTMYKEYLKRMGSMPEIIFPESTIGKTFENIKNLIEKVHSYTDSKEAQEIQDAHDIAEIEEQYSGINEESLIRIIAELYSIPLGQAKTKLEKSREIISEINDEIDKAANKRESILEDEEKIIKVVDAAVKATNGKYDTLNERRNYLKDKYGFTDEDIDYMYEIYSERYEEVLDQTYEELSNMDMSEIDNERMRYNLENLKSFSKDDLRIFNIMQLDRFYEIIYKVNQGVYSGRLTLNYLIPLIATKNAKELTREQNNNKLQRKFRKALYKGRTAKVEDLIRKTLDVELLYNYDKIFEILDLYSLTGGDLALALSRARQANDIVHNLQGFINESVKNKNYKQIVVNFDINTKGANRLAIVSAIMGMYLREREALANGETGNIVRESLDALKEEFVKNQNNSNLRLEQRTLDMFEEIYDALPKTADGSIDLEQTYEKFTTPVKQYIEYYDSMAGKLLDMAYYSQSIFRGGIFNPVASHFHRMAYNSTDSMDAISEEQLKSLRMFDNKTSVRASSTHERTSKAPAEYFDAFDSIKRNIIDTYQDYYISETFKVISDTLSIAAQQYEGNSYGNRLFSEIAKMHNEQIRQELMAKKLNLTKAGRATNNVFKHGTSSMLLRVHRMPIELFSNLTAYIKYPQELNDGFAENSSEYMQLIKDNSTHAERQGVYTQEKNITEMETSYAANKMWIDIWDVAIDAMIKNPFARAKFKATEKIVGTADRMLSIPLWVGSFRKNFKEMTGEEFNISEYNNNSDYRVKHNRNIKKASINANQVVSRVFTSSNPIEVKGMLTRMSPEERRKIINRVKYLLYTFGYNDHRNAVNALKGLGKGQLADPITMLALVYLRQVSYSILMQMALQLMKLGISSLSGGSDDEWERYIKRYSSWEGWLRSMSAGILNIWMGGYNALARSLTALTIEVANAALTKNIFIDSSYAAKDDAVTYSPLNPENVHKDSKDATKILLMVSGAVSNYMATGLEARDYLYSKNKDEQKGWALQIEVLATMADATLGVPFMNDMIKLSNAAFKATYTNPENFIHNKKTIDDYLVARQKQMGDKYTTDKQAVDAKEFRYYQTYGYGDEIAEFLFKKNPQDALYPLRTGNEVKAHYLYAQRKLFEKAGRLYEFENRLDQYKLDMEGYYKVVGNTRERGKVSGILSADVYKQYEKLIDEKK